MAEELQGGLTIASAGQGGPNPVTNPLAALQANALTRSNEGYDYMKAQQAAYQKDMDTYAQMVEQSRLPENNEAAMWGSMAGAAADVAPQWGNIGQMLGKTGAAYGGFQEQQQIQNLKNQGDITKLRQAEVRALEAKDQNAAMLKMQLGGKFVTRPLSDGTIMVLNNVSGQATILGPVEMKTVSANAQKLADEAMAKNPQLTIDQANEWGMETAMANHRRLQANLGNAPDVVKAGGTTANPNPAPGTVVPGTVPNASPVAGTSGVPVTKTPTPVGFPRVSPQEQASRDAERDAIRLKEAETARTERDTALTGGNAEAASTAGGNLASLHRELASTIAALPVEKRADAERNFQRYVANPNQGTLSALEASLSRSGAIAKPTISAAQASAAGEKKTAEKAAEEHSKYSTEVTERSQNFQNMSTMLDGIDRDLQGLKPGSPVEPGKLANFNTGALSWMKAMGVPLSKEGEDAIASAIALGKANIKLSAADTKAISSRPAVFEFMQMLKSNPGPELTPETIQKLTGKMRENIRIGAQENQDFSDWHKENPVAPVADFTNYRNLVHTPWWSKFAEKYNAANGRYPTYADISADAKERGLSFNDMVRKMHAESSKVRK